MPAGAYRAFVALLNLVEHRLDAVVNGSRLRNLSVGDDELVFVVS